MFRILFLLPFVLIAAIHHFGWIEGIGLTAAIWTLMPYQYDLRNSISLALRDSEEREEIRKDGGTPS